MARMPTLSNLDSLASRCLNLQGEQLVIPKSDCIKLAHDYKRLLTYIAELQDVVIDLKRQDATEVEIRSPDF
jgi:hypothetical protein